MKKFLCFLLALALCLSPAIVFAPVSQAANVILIGDVDGSGSVTKDDATLLSQYLAGWEGCADKMDMDAADVNRDGKVTKADAAILARYAAGWDGYDMYINTLFIKNPLTIVNEPLDVEMMENAATLSITVSGEFDSIVYEWQKLTTGGWRAAPTLNSDDATYTVNNSALQIISKNGTEGFGEYRCVVSAFYKDTLVKRVTSRTATVDPQTEPMKALLGRLYPGHYYYYYYHCINRTEELEPGTEKKIGEQPIGYVLKNYTAPRYREATKEIPLEPLWECGYDNGEWPDFVLYNGIPYDSGIALKTENGEYYTTEVLMTHNHAKCTVESLSGGKGPYTYTWYLSKDRFGNDFNPLIEGVNCRGQGTETILVWPSDTSSQGIRFMGFLCCRVTDSKGRTTNACYNLESGLQSADYTFKDHVYHCYNMLYALGEDDVFFESPNATLDHVQNTAIYWYTYPNNDGLGRWW